METTASTLVTMGMISDIVYNDNENNINYFTKGYDFTANGTTYKVIDHTPNSTLSGF